MIIFFIAVIILFTGCITQEELPPLDKYLKVNESKTYVLEEPLRSINFTPLKEVAEKNITPKEKKTVVVYFFKYNCPACMQLQPYILNLNSTYTDVEWHIYELTEHYGLYENLTKKYNVSDDEKYVPAVFIGSEYLWGIGEILSSLEKKIIYCEETKSCENPLR